MKGSQQVFGRGDEVPRPDLLRYGSSSCQVRTCLTCALSCYCHRAARAGTGSGTGCQQLSTSCGIRLPARELLLGKNVVRKSCSALMKIKRRFTSVLVGARSRQEATCFDAAENSKLSSWSGHQRRNVPSAQLGRNSVP